MGYISGMKPAHLNVPSMKNPSIFLPPVLALLSLAATVSHAAEIWSESFDDPDTAKVGFNNGTASQYSFEDYSAMTLTSVNPATGPVSHTIPAAPHTLAGSASTRGLLLRVVYETVTANPDPDPPTITATAVTERILNVVALTEKDGGRLALEDNYRLKFDFYLRLSPSITLSPTTGLANETGTTENMLWGIGYNAFLPMARGWRTGRGNGMWGWLTTEGGYGTTVGSDASLYKGPTALIARNLGKAASVDVPDTVNFFTPAFGLASSPMPSAPANQWVQAVITVSGGLVTLEYKGEGVAGTVLTKFATNENGVGSTAGTVMVGYEDASSSKSFAELDQWMLLDNMVVEDITPPTLAVTPD
ncbi:MAG: hypothetical protein JWL81_161, partial [Verrucomicrobiales bacterium]|nr:hypothetical protein [Verrucomicrobiales bacterium]